MHSNVQQKDYGCGFTPYEAQITFRLLNYDDLDVDIIRFSTHQEESVFPFKVRQVKFPSFPLFYMLHLPIMNLFAPLFSRTLNSRIGSKPGDVFIFYENKIPNVPLKGKIIAVLHDVLPLRIMKLRYAGWLEGFLRRYIFKRNVRDMIRIADKIITVSEFSKRDILDYLNLKDDGKIEVVHSVVDNEDVYLTPRDDLDSLREKYGLPKKYILYVGACFPYKNVNTLIRAYACLPESLRSEYKLVVTNPQNVTRECADECGASSDVIFLNRIPEKDKPGIYQAASLFVWPSIFEGFGLPVIEAQAAGVPVVCSNAASMPEVAGDSAVLVDPHDTQEMASAMERVLTNDSLRNELIARGYKNIKRFSWDESARKLHDIIISL